MLGFVDFRGKIGVRPVTRVGRVVVAVCVALGRPKHVSDCRDRSGRTANIGRVIRVLVWIEGNKIM